MQSENKPRRGVCGRGAHLKSACRVCAALASDCGWAKRGLHALGDAAARASWAGAGQRPSKREGERERERE
eukprot:5539314-Pleurochrysis_carterae.AAC.2